MIIANDLSYTGLNFIDYQMILLYTVHHSGTNRIPTEYAKENKKRGMNMNINAYPQNPGINKLIQLNKKQIIIYP